MPDWFSPPPIQPGDWHGWDADYDGAGSGRDRILPAVLSGAVQRNRSLIEVATGCACSSGLSSSVRAGCMGEWGVVDRSVAGRLATLLVIARPLTNDLRRARLAQ